MDSSPRPEPQRLSALYQYHNAPEVAPAHGLEYDDTIYPSSDKYPVVREHPLYDGRGGRYAFGGDNRPPRIIFGMKVRTFLLVAAVMVVIIVGAAVGGAVGGQSLRENQSQTESLFTNGNSSASGGPTPSSAPSATFSAATPTYTPLSDCPDSNNTRYTSSFAAGSSGTVPEGAGLDFTKHCDLQNPLSITGTQRIAEAFVYTFSDCVEVCAAYNFWNAGSNCTVAVYQPSDGRPGNCWVGHAGRSQTSHLNETQGTDVAILNG